ncbi:kinase-like domain-containing protein [Scenedesmus sp. NREL 46B-D3]|nr:kinase-like domain-containing protein [Scenedesmus sp. NREL 46B-D3]
MLAVMATTAEVAAAMLLLHRAGIVHGDLSAANVLLSSCDYTAGFGGRNFVAKVTDFGLQQRYDPATLADNPYHSIAHLAPEVLQHGTCTKAADVYSFGVLIFMMATGSSAWAGLPHAAIVEAVCTHKRQLAFAPEAPLPLTLLARACMAHNLPSGPASST